MNTIVEYMHTYIGLFLKKNALFVHAFFPIPEVALMWEIHIMLR